MAEALGRPDPCEMPSSQPRVGDRLQANAVLTVAQLSLVATALVNWVGSSLTFFGEALDHWDYVGMAIGFGAASVLLLLLLIPARALRCSGWVTAMALALSAGCAAASLVALRKASGAEQGTLLGEPLPWAVELVAWSPAHWGTLLLVAATPLLRRKRVRGSSSPEPRPLPVH